MNCYLILRHNKRRAYRFFSLMIIYLSCICINFCSAQNLVINGDFETYSSIPTESGQIERAVGWSAAKNAGIPDYFHRYSPPIDFWVGPEPLRVGIPVNFRGDQSPDHQDYPVNNAYAGICIDGNFQYLVGRLSEPLKQGKRYLVKYLLNMGDNSAGAVSIGACFTEQPYEKIWNNPNRPQIESERIDDTYLFRLVSGILKVPKGKEYNYITLGHFYGQNWGASWEDQVYYYIDDVSVEEICSANAGDNLTVCKGTTITLPIPDNPNFTWYYEKDGVPLYDNVIPSYFNDQDASQYILVVTGPYNCIQRDTVTVYTGEGCACIDSCFGSGNELVNGDFEANVTNWTGQYQVDNNFTPGHTGRISDAASLDNRLEGRDHTFAASGEGKFLFVDGHANDPIDRLVQPFFAAPNRIWCNSVVVKKNWEYEFSAWFMNLVQNIPELATYDDPVVHFSVNGKLIGEPFTISKTNTLPLIDKWSKHSAKWFSGDDETAEICIQMLTSKYWGNDLGIDDICFSASHPSAGPDKNLCTNSEAYQFPHPMEGGQSWRYEIVSGDPNGLEINGSEFTGKPSFTTTYRLTVNRDLCSYFEDITLFVKNCCDCPTDIPKGGFDLVLNGDFENDLEGFTTDYAVNPGPGTFPGGFFVLNTVNGFNNNTWAQNGNPSKFLYADGHLEANKVVWRQTIKDIVPGTNYDFCMDVNNLLVPGYEWNVDPDLEVRINGVAIGSGTIPELPDEWNKVSYSWLANSTTAKIEIVNKVSGVQNGVDFGIDNIGFRPCRRSITSGGGNDTLICQNGSLPLDRPAGWTHSDYYVTSEGTPYVINDATVSPVRNTTYVLHAYDNTLGFSDYDTTRVTVKCCWCNSGIQNQGQNLINNGDFSSGNVGFNTGYYFNNSPALGSTPGSCNVAQNASMFNANWDKSGNDGKFLMVNGATSNQVAWRQTIPVQPHTNYSLCTDFVNLNKAPGFSSQNDPELKIKINGTVVGSYTADEKYTWTPVSAGWNSGSSSTAVIEMMSSNTSVAGNDFGIDNISFKPCNSSSARYASTEGENIGMDSLTTEEVKIEIYPNPALNEITVHTGQAFKNCQLAVIDVHGKKVMTSALNSAEARLNISSLASGVYFISLLEGEIIRGKKSFVKE